MCSQFELNVRSIDFLCGHWQATVWNKLTSAPFQTLGLDVQPRNWFLRTVSSDSLQRCAYNWTTLNADVANDCCSVDYGKPVTVTNILSAWHVLTTWTDVRSRDLLVRTLTSNNEKPADIWTILNAGTWCTPGLCQGTVCRDELTAEPHQTLMSPLHDVVPDYGKPETVNNLLWAWHVLTASTICTAQRVIHVVCNKQKSAEMR